MLVEVSESDGIILLTNVGCRNWRRTRAAARGQDRHQLPLCGFRRAHFLTGLIVVVCPNERLSGGLVVPRLEAGAEDSAFGSAGERTKSCGLLAPGRVRSCGLLRWVRSCGLLGLTPGGYPPRPCANVRFPDRRKVAIVAHISVTLVARICATM